MTALREENTYFRRRQILASNDRWEMNAAYLVLRWNMFSSCVCVCVQANFLLLYFVCAGLCDCVYVLPTPWHCLVITQICAQSEEIMNEIFNYASRQRSLMPPQHRWHAEMGEVRLNRKPFSFSGGV